MKNYSASKSLFDNAIYDIAEDDAEELFHSKIFVPIIIVGLGNTVFVRQLKLIWQSQKINIEKNQPQKKKNQLSSTLLSTVCLLHPLFEDLGCAIELHEN
jgi:hypothetical protein